MGKGKRTRQLRKTTTGTTIVAAGYPFVVDTATASKLGHDGLAVLARNLWPQDCQT